MEEEWRNSILPYIKVSNLGRVKREDRYVNSQTSSGKQYRRFQKGSIIKGYSNGLGYLQVRVGIDGYVLRKYVHVLVAEAFIEKPESGLLLDVNHIDHDKSNNNVDNLEWVTKSENQNKQREFYGTDKLTYRSRNKDKFFCHCGKEKSKRANSCKNCLSKRK